MSYYFRGEAHTNSDWDNVPDFVEIVITDKNMEELKAAVEFVKGSAFSYVAVWYFAGYQFFDEGSEDAEVADEVDFHIDGTHVKVYADGHFQFQLQFENSHDEIWTDDFTLDEGVHRQTVVES